MSYHFCEYQVLFQKINMYYKHWLDIALNGGKHWLQRTSTATTSMAPVNVLIYQNTLYNIRWPSKIKMHIDKFWWRCRYIYIYIYVRDSSSTVIAVYWWINQITMTSECSESFIDASPVSLITGETDCWCWFLSINAQLITEPQKD